MKGDVLLRLKIYLIWTMNYVTIFSLLQKEFLNSI